MKNSKFIKSYDFVTKAEAAKNNPDIVGKDFMEFLGFNPLQNSFDIQSLQKIYATADDLHDPNNCPIPADQLVSKRGIEVGQIASSLIFKLPDDSPLLIITSGRHRVDTELVAKNLGIEKLGRVDADYVKEKSGFSIGGVAPIGWVSPATILIDQALNDYEVVWAAAGHPHAVYPTTFAELIECTGAQQMIVGD